MDRAELIKVIKEAELDYDNPITAEEISDILFEYGWDRNWYIEELRSDAGRWDAFCYLSCYDENARAIILMKDIWWEFDWFESEDDVADAIMEWDELYKHYHNKFLIFKKD